MSCSVCGKELTGQHIKVEKDGVIQKYSLRVDYSKLGKNLMAYIFMGFESAELDEDIRGYIEREEEIIECSFITGDFDYILKVVTKDTASLTRHIHKLKNFRRVTKTRTIVILENIKDEKDIIF